MVKVAVVKQKIENSASIRQLRIFRLQSHPTLQIHMARIQKQKRSPVDLYIAGFPKEISAQLETIRTIIRKAAPKSAEIISYSMPAYKMNRVLVYFAAAKNHIGFYPTSTPIIAFKEELKKYKTSKGAIQFPIKEKIPVGLVTRIVKYRIKEETSKANLKLNISGRTVTNKGLLKK